MTIVEASITAEQLVDRVWSIRKQLDAAGISYEVRLLRYDGVTILAHVPGEYWEIDVLENGRVDFEIFRSVDDVQCESDLHAAIAEIQRFEAEAEAELESKTKPKE